MGLSIFRYTGVVLIGVFGVFAVAETPNPYRWVIAGLIVALIAVIWVVRHYAHRDVNDASKRAREYGWQLKADQLPSWTCGLTRFPFTLVKDGTIHLQAKGVWRGFPAESFLVAGASNEGARVYYITRLWMKKALPSIEFHPKSDHSRVLDLGSDMALESAVFNSRWRVMAVDLVYAHAVAHPRLMERLLSSHGTEMPITIDGSSIYTWSTSMRRAHKRFERSLDLLADVVELIPPHVQREYGVSNKAASMAVKQSSRSTRVSTTPFTVPKRDRNHLARLSLAFAGTLLLAPVAVVVGHIALRAAKRGEANNPRTARIALILGYVLSLVMIAAYVSAART